eukprot:UN21020
MESNYIITVNKGLLFIKYVNAISITFRIIKRFNFIYRILVLLKYLFNLRRPSTIFTSYNEKCINKLLFSWMLTIIVKILISFNK